ncbi:hypothetical protein [Acetobacter pasteurianus]|nr:hypothetical protein [Acetobacter pasteurianus]
MLLSQPKAQHHRLSEAGYTPLQVGAGLMMVALLTSLGAALVSEGLKLVHEKTIQVQLGQIVEATESLVSAIHSYDISTSDLSAQGTLSQEFYKKDGTLAILGHDVKIVGYSDHTSIEIPTTTMRICIRLLLTDYGSRVVQRSANSYSTLSRTASLPDARNACMDNDFNTVTLNIR